MKYDVRRFWGQMRYVLDDGYYDYRNFNVLSETHNVDGWYFLWI